jgi:hypothetical protein
MPGAGLAMTAVYTHTRRKPSVSNSKTPWPTGSPFPVQRKWLENRLVIEEEDGRRVIKPAAGAEPVRWEGNVLVRDGVLLADESEVLDEIRHQRHDDLLKGESA